MTACRWLIVEDVAPGWSGPVRIEGDSVVVDCRRTRLGAWCRCRGDRVRAVRSDRWEGWS